MAQVSRRTVAKGAAWSVPVVAVAGTSPAFAASTPPVVTDDCKDNIPANAGPYWPSDGAHTVSTTGGALINATTTYNYGINDLSRGGSVTVKFYDGISQTYVARPYVTLNNGARYCGTATLGGTGTFIAGTGVSTSVAVLWDRSINTNDSTLWNGVTAHIPFIYYWTSNGQVRSAQYEMQVTYPSTGAYSAGVQPTTVKYVKASYGCLAQGCSPTTPWITSVTPGYAPAGSEVTITGSSFTGVTSVTYGTATLTKFQVVSDTEIKATMPATWPSGMAWGIVYYYKVCKPTTCSNVDVGRARG